MNVVRLCLCCICSNVSAATWYVDNSLSSSANTGISWANAWTNFASIVWGGAGWNQGDTLYISGGTTSKTYYETLGPFNLCYTTGPYSYIKTGIDAGHTGKVIIDGQGANTDGISAVGNHKLVIDGSSGLDLTNLVVRNWYNPSNNSTGRGIAYGGNQSGWLHHLEIYDCNIGIYNAGDPLNSVISHCYLHGIRGNAGIQLNNSTQKSWDATIVSNCNIYVNFDTNQTPTTGSDGIQCGSGVTVHDCYFGTVTATNVQNQHSDAFQQSGEFCKMYNCEVVDIVNAALEGGSSITNTGDLMFYNNIVRRTSATTWMAYNRGVEWNVYPGPAPTSITNVHIYNNTFIDLTNWNVITFTYHNADSDAPTNQPAFTDFNIKNNLFHNCGDTGHDSVIKLYPNTNAVYPNVDIDYNLMSAGAHGITNIIADGVEYLQVHPRVGTPAFVYYSECDPRNDFRLSPVDITAKDLGVDLSMYFWVDKSNRSRIGYWDIGAYESGTYTSAKTLTVGTLTMP